MLPLWPPSCVIVFVHWPHRNAWFEAIELSSVSMGGALLLGGINSFIYIYIGIYLFGRLV